MKPSFTNCKQKRKNKTGGSWSKHQDERSQNRVKQTIKQTIF